MFKIFLSGLRFRELFRGLDSTPVAVHLLGVVDVPKGNFDVLLSVLSFEINKCLGFNQHFLDLVTLKKFLFTIVTFMQIETVKFNERISF